MTNETMLAFVNELKSKGEIDWVKMLKVKQTLEDDVLKDAAKAAGSRKAQQTAIRILKNRNRPDLQSAWIKDDVQYFLDGFVGFALKKHLPLPLRAEEKVKLADIINSTRYKNDKEITLPTQAELLGHIKLSKAEGNKLHYWSFGEGMPLVDAQKLYDVLEILPNASATCSSPLSSLYFTADNGEGILSPVNPTKVTKGIGKGV